MRKKTERCEYERTTPSSFASTYISDVCARRHGFYVEKNKKKRRRVGHALKVFFCGLGFTIHASNEKT